MAAMGKFAGFVAPLEWGFLLVFLCLLAAGCNSPSASTPAAPAKLATSGEAAHDSLTAGPPSPVPPPAAAVSGSAPPTDPGAAAQPSTASTADGPPTSPPPEPTQSVQSEQPSEPSPPAADGTTPPSIEPSTASTAADEEPSMPDHPFARRIKAPGLDGGVAWINTAGPLELEQLRGKFVLLDFWTYCCINCMHVLPELKKLEAAYPRELVVIGVHSAKFDNEADSENIIKAVLRHGIEHPVVNDANHAIWNRFGVRSWPSILLIDPLGYAVLYRSGEFQFEQMNAVLREAIPYYRKKGLLDETPLRFDLEAFKTTRTPLRFPGKILADETGNRLFIADSSHNRIVIATLDGKLLDVVGDGQVGARNGTFEQARFNHPQGMALRDTTLYVADTENHLLRKLDLKTRRVGTVAGTGHQSRNPWPGLEQSLAGNLILPQRWVGKPRATALGSPWDLWIHDRDLYIAMAGPHQIWKMRLDGSEIGPYAGNGREDIVDGPLLPREPYEFGFASFAQPSGLASDGTWLYVADSEGSSIRAVPFDPKQKVRTVVGTAHLDYGRLFAFGDVDGRGPDVRLQHCLGVVWHDGLLYVADTYNDKIKSVDPLTGETTTIAGGKAGSSDDPPMFYEPAGISVAAGKLYVADTNNHLVRVIDLTDNFRVATLEIAGLAPPDTVDAAPAVALPGTAEIELPEQKLRPVDGKLKLAVAIELPEGYKLNPDAPLRYQVEPALDSGPVDRQAIAPPARLEKPSESFEIELPVSAPIGRDRVKLSVAYYYCRQGAEGLCKAASAVWIVPLQLAADAPESVLHISHKPD